MIPHEAMSAHLCVLLCLPFLTTQIHPPEINIGLLSHTNLKDEQTAFLYAIDQINEDGSLLSQTTLNPIVADLGSIEDTPSNIVRNVFNLVNQRVAAVVGPFRSSHSQLASYILSEMTVPMITPTSTDPFLRNPNWSEYLLHMQPLDEYQSKALLDLVRHMGWNRVALISSMDSYGINGLSTFQKYSFERKIKIVANEMVPLTNDLDSIDVTTQMLNLKNSAARIIIMNVHSGYARKILEIADEMGMVGPDYGWIVTDGTVKDASNMLNSTTGQFDRYVQGVVGFMTSMCCADKRRKLMEDFHVDVDGVSGDGSWADSKNLTLQSRASLVYDSVYVIAHALQTMIYDDNQPFKTPDVDFWSDPVKDYKSGETLLRYILRVKDYDGLTGKISFDSEGGPIKKTYDLVNFRKNNIVKVGEWKENIGLSMTPNTTILWNGEDDDVPSSTVKSLKGMTLRLGITQEPPFINIDTECTNSGVYTRKCFTGLCIELVDLLAELLEFDYEYVLSEDNKFGTPEPNGTWNGLIKMLLDGKIDIGAVNFAMNRARESAIDFSMPFINTGLVMTSRIKETKSDPFFWTKPFDIDLWYAILAFAMLMVLLIWLYDHMSPFGFYGRRMHAALRCSCKNCEAFRCNKEASGSEDEDECLFETRLCDPSENNEELMNVGNSLWMIAACLFSIGPVEGVPRNMSGRVILAMWWFMILIVTAMYTANLAAFLTVTRMQIGINSISDLISQNKVKWGTVNGTNAQILLEAAKSPDLQEVYARMETVNTVDEGFRRARETDYIFFYGGAIVAFEANKQPCDLQIVGEQLFSFGYAFGFPPQSPYLETFNSALLNLSGRNELDALWKKWSKGDCTAKSKTTKSSSLNLANIYGLCYTFFVVIAVSAVILIGEILYESIMDVNRFKTTFIDALKYRLIYIWKKPEYQILADSKGSKCATPKSKHSSSHGSKTGVTSAVEYDGASKTIKSDDMSFQYLPYDMGGQGTRPNTGSKTSVVQPEVKPMIPNKEYIPNGYPATNNIDHPPSFKDTLMKPIILPHDYSPEIMYNSVHPYHRSLAHSYAGDSDNSKAKSMPRSVHKHRPRHHGKPRLPPTNGHPSNGGGGSNPQLNYADLFDRTLERMTSHVNGGAGEPVFAAKRTTPHKGGASLSTRSPSPMYSSQDINSHVMSDTDELRTESDCMSPPP